MRYVNITAAFEANKGNVVVWHAMSLGGQLADRWMWCAEKDGEVLDYHRKEVLVDHALASGEKVVVLTLHRDHTVSAEHRLQRTPKPHR